MVVGPVQPGLGEALHQPAEQRLVAHVHPQRHLGLLAVAAERALADQQPDEQPAVEVRELRPATACYSGRVVSPHEKNVKRRASWRLRGRRSSRAGSRRDRPRSVHERRHDEPSVGLLALAVRLDVVTALQVLVDDLALERAHRLERDRPPVVDRGLGGLVGGGPQRDGAALAVAGGVDHDADRRRRVRRNAIR